MGVGPGAGGQGQRDVHRAVHRVPGAAALVVGHVAGPAPLVPLGTTAPRRRPAVVCPRRNRLGVPARSAGRPARCPARRARPRWPAGVGSTVGARRKSPSCSGSAFEQVVTLLAVGLGRGDRRDGDGLLVGDRCRDAAMPRTVISTETATTTAAMSRARGGPSTVCESVTPPTLWPVRRWRSGRSASG